MLYLGSLLSNSLQPLINAKLESLNNRNKYQTLKKMEHLLDSVSDIGLPEAKQELKNGTVYQHSLVTFMSKNPIRSTART